MELLPKDAMDELDIYSYAILLKIKHFRGVYMRDTMPVDPLANECAVVNLDSIRGPGTHWIAYSKHKNIVYYFDSFGNLPPPVELIEYFGNGIKMFYNHYNYQPYNTSICGQLCLQFLHHFNKYFI
jgi:hypothetical protein